MIAFTPGPESVPEITPSIREVTRIVAGLGGFLGRKGDDEPGDKSLWIGLQRLDTISAAWLAFGPECPTRARVQRPRIWVKRRAEPGGLPIGLAASISACSEFSRSTGAHLFLLLLGLQFLFLFRTKLSLFLFFSFAFVLAATFVTHNGSSMCFSKRKRCPERQ